MTRGKDPTKWFKIWQSIIYKEKEISRLQLAEKSGASIWTMKSLQKDFVEWDAYIVYKNNKFSLVRTDLIRTLSTLSDSELKDLR